MSICNVWVEPARALVAVDTAAQSILGSENSKGNKVLHFANQNILLAGRGQLRFLLEVFASLWNVPNMDAIEVLPVAGFDAGFADYIQRGQTGGIADLALSATVELVFVGWSHKRDRMVAVRFERLAGDAPFTKSAMTDGNWLAPNAEWSASNPPPRVDDAEKMMRIAHQQIKFARQEDPGAIIGGCLILVEVMKGRMTRELADLSAAER